MILIFYKVNFVGYSLVGYPICRWVPEAGVSGTRRGVGYPTGCRVPDGASGTRRGVRYPMPCQVRNYINVINPIIILTPECSID